MHTCIQATSAGWAGTTAPPLARHPRLPANHTQVPHWALHAPPALVLALHRLGRAVGGGECGQEAAQVGGARPAQRSGTEPGGALGPTGLTSRLASQDGPRREQAACCAVPTPPLPCRRAAAKKGRPADQPVVPTMVAWPLFQILRERRRCLRLFLAGVLCAAVRCWPGCPLPGKRSRRRVATPRPMRPLKPRPLSAPGPQCT